MNIKFHKCFVFTVLALSLLITKTAYSRQMMGQYIGKVNLEALVLFHPLMIGYDPQKQAFKVDSRVVPLRVQKQQLRKRNALLSALKNKRKRLSANIDAEERNYDRHLQMLSKLYLSKMKKLATGPAAIKKASYSIEENRVEKRHSGVLMAMTSKMRMLDKQIDKLTRLQGSIGYTTPEQTEKKIATIIAEIKRYTKQIASQKGISIVLNSGGNNIKSQAINSAIPCELCYSNIFTKQFPKVLLRDSAAVSGYYSEIRSIAYNWMANGDNILEPFAAQLKNKDIFIGGVDLTPEVMASIFRAYKIDQNISNTIIRSVSSF